MHDARTVGVLQGVQHARRDLDGFRDRDGLPVAEELAHCMTLDVLHDDVGHRAGGAVGVGELLLTGVVDGDDGRVVQGRGGLGLAAEARLEGDVTGDVRAQQLNGDDA